MARRRNRRRNRKRRNQAGVLNPNVAKLTRAICAVSDPFCGHAEGAVDPIGSNQPTFTWSSRGQFTVNTSTNCAFVVFDPHPNTSQVYNAGSSSSTFPITTAFNTATTVFPTFVSQSRPVSAGIRWWFVGAMTDPGGVVQVMQLSRSSDLLDGSTHAIATYSANTAAFTDLRKPGAFVCTPTGDTPNEFFSAGSDDPFTDPFLSPVFLRVTGAASTAVLQVEYVIHYESTVLPVGGLKIGQKRKPQTALTDFRMSQTGGYLEGSLNSVSAQLKQGAASLAKTAASYGISRGFQMLGDAMFPGAGTFGAGPMAGAASRMIMDVDQDANARLSVSP